VLKKLVLFVVLLVVATVATNYLAFSSKFEYRVERDMAAQPEAIIAAFKDLKTWEDWSPWSLKKHPNDGAKFEYSGEPGSGMTWNWSEGKELGEGSLTISRVASGAVDYDFAMKKPIAMEIKAGIELSAAGDKTRVVWWSKGEQDMPGIGRIMNKVFAGQVKKDYADALAGLDAYVAAK